MGKSTTRLSNWRYWDQHVQSEVEGGQYINASTIMIAAGPPRLSDATKGDIASANDIAYPIGILENIGIAQNRGLQRMFEIGSRRSYFIPGRTVGSVSLGRVLYYGPSLLRVLMAYYPHSKIKGANSIGGENENSAFGRELDGGARTPQILENPGYGGGKGANNRDFFINLASDLFDHSLGLLVYIRDSNDDSYGAFYMEDVHISSHSININASSVLVAESVTAQYDRIVPINVNNVKTDRSSADIINLGL